MKFSFICCEYFSNKLENFSSEVLEEISLDVIKQDENKMFLKEKKWIAINIGNLIRRTNSTILINEIMGTCQSWNDC